MKDTVAIYCLLNTTINVLIPKRRGTGYCKSVFGFHSANKVSETFDTLRDYGKNPFNWFAGDTCDIDGYLSIETKLFWMDERYKEGARLTISALKVCFPFVTEFKQVDPDYFFKQIV
mgnify:CR=1 FL=1